MDATTGLHRSQPLPLPCSATSWLKVRMPVARTISNSSARDWPKCSHRALDCSTPQLVSSCLSVGTQDPQPVPAFVHILSDGTSAQPAPTAATMSALVTAWQEHTWASSGSAGLVTPGGAISEPGSAGSGRPTKARSVAYESASPTSTPPSSVLASSETTIFL